MLDLPSLGALAMTTAEFLTLGWLSGSSFPGALPGVGTAPTWALRALVGSCLVALAQVGLGLLGIPFGSIATLLLVAGLAAVALRILVVRPAALQRPPTGARGVADGVGRAEALGWLLLGVVLLAAVVRALVVPESGWDAYSHWGLRAQAYALASRMVDAHSEHEYYPPLVPLLEAWLYLHRGAVAIDLGKTVWAVIGSAFAICLAWHVRITLRPPLQRLAPYLATGIVLGAAPLLESFWTGQADLALTTYLSLSTLALAQWLRQADRRWLVQAGLFAAAAALSKFEGLPRMGIVLVALLLEGALLRERAIWRPALVVGLAAGLAGACWIAIEVALGIAPNGEHIGALQPLALGSVLLALAAVFGGVRTGGGLLVGALAWLVCARGLFSAPLRLLTLVVLGQLAGTLLGFLLSATDPATEVHTSATRLFEQFLPLGLLVGAVGLAETLLPVQEPSSTYNRRGR